MMRVGQEKHPPQQALQERYNNQAADDNADRKTRTRTRNAKHSEIKIQKEGKGDSNQIKYLVKNKVLQTRQGEASRGFSVAAKDKTGPAGPIPDSPIYGISQERNKTVQLSIH